MKLELIEIERAINKHQHYLNSLRDGIFKGVQAGMKEGANRGIKKGVREGLKECLAQSFRNVPEGIMEDVVGIYSDLTIGEAVNHETSHVIETSIVMSLDRLYNGIISEIRGRKLALAVDQIESVVELVRERYQRIGQWIVEKLPRGLLPTAVAVGIQIALDNGFNRNIEDFRIKIRKMLEGAVKAQWEEPKELARERKGEQPVYIESPIRDAVAHVVEEISFYSAKKVTKRAVANLSKEQQKKVSHRLEAKKKNVLSLPGVPLIKPPSLKKTMSSLPGVPLAPTSILNEDWEFSEWVTEPPITGVKTEQVKVIEWIRSIRIQIAEAAETTKINTDDKYDYLLSEMGMNIIVPTGNIEELRFKVTLVAKDGVVAVDGFPKDVIDEKEIVHGRIKMGISKALMFIPIVGPLIEQAVDVELVKEFSLGSLKKVNVDFSGGLTSHPEWLFKKDGIRNDLRVALTIRKSKRVENIEAELKAAWIYNSGSSWKKELRLGTNAKTITIC